MSEGEYLFSSLALSVSMYLQINPTTSVSSPPSWIYTFRIPVYMTTTTHVETTDLSLHCLLLHLLLAVIYLFIMCRGTE